MKNKFLFLTHVIFALCFPFAIGHFTPANDGLSYLFLLFVVLNPLYSAFVGYVISKDFRGLWFHIPLLAVLFLIGVIVVFGDLDSFFLISIFAYLLITLTVAWLLSKKQKVKK